MGKINVLENQISSKIAAGEVIERPVSVVKELVENSIDAGSKNITVEIQKGGKQLIRVVDDGEGILREEIKLAFLRHATSKITKLDDIFNINTLGFRGEALASIASVSKVTVISKTAEEMIGTKGNIKGGILEELQDASANEGLFLEVKDLFFNTPARLKFLKSDTQEASKITDLITRFAIGNINISFRLINDGKEIFFTSGNGDYREAIAKVYGVDVARHMLYVEKNFDGGKVWGYIALPQHSRGNRQGQTFFVNNRYVKDKSLVFSLERAYKTRLPISRFPVSIIFIDIDNTLIDVNVHPSKTEVKFQREKDVNKALYYAVYDALKSQVLIPKETFEKPLIAKPKLQSQKVETQMQLEEKSLPNSAYFPKNPYKIYNKPEDNFTTASFVKEPAVPIDKDKKDFLDISKPDEAVFIDNYTLPIEEPIEESLNSTNKFSYDKILGQLFNTYIVAESKGRFYLIDQHAAHERILYEHYSSKFYNKASQDLVAPYVLHLSAQEMVLIEEYKEDIKNAGFDFSLFGNDSLLIRTVPYFFNKPVDPIVLRDVLDQISSQDYTGFLPKERFIISMSCHTAIKAGDILSTIEIEELLTQLKNTKNPYTCPHGRPTIITMTLYELEKKFKRT